MKRWFSLILVLALCLGLGAPVLADGEDAEPAGPALPRLDVYLDGCGDYEEGLTDNAAYGMDSFLWARATVPLADIDRALGYLVLLEEGPFQLELEQCLTTLTGTPGGDVPADHCAELAYGPDVLGFSATFAYAGEGDAGLIPGAMAPVGGGSAVGVAVQPNEEEATAAVSLFCGAGFRFAEQWQAQDRDGTLPDPFTFFGGQVSYQYEEKTSSHQNHVTFRFVGEDLAPAEAYAALLADPRYGLTLADELHGVTNAGNDYAWWKFDYTGEKEVGQVTFFGDDAEPCSVYVYGSVIGDTTVNIRYAPDGFVFADYGDVYPEPLTDAFSDPASRGRLTCVVGTAGASK